MKPTKFYPAEDLLAGRFRGRRVVFLKQLESGLLLVTGPFRVNGVPLRRVAQAYVIATSTKVELPELDLAKFDDAYFKKVNAPAAPKTAEAFFEDTKAVLSELPASRIADQKNVDKAILASINKVPQLAKYMAGTFSLSNGQIPHLLKF
ncbi:ribosomal protein L6e-domain-containing protein [Catenaria anguillulae PL171]|uniref:60S ribosomal protein L6 n=1 Tax=Catenaria anguillulae PL171 TaxID=765915 RepID=A0A1Y2HZI7_9FUNG|nr:ribosomal protein L6e-domain-containing protein [Catenaria anguillulae PL171]